MNKKLERHHSVDEAAPAKHTIWVGNIPDDLAQTEGALSKALARYGSVLTATVRLKPGVRKHWALVSFSHRSAMDAVLAATVVVPGGSSHGRWSHSEAT